MCICSTCICNVGFLVVFVTFIVLKYQNFVDGLLMKQYMLQGCNVKEAMHAIGTSHGIGEGTRNNISVIQDL